LEGIIYILTILCVRDIASRHMLSFGSKMMPIC